MKVSLSALRARQGVVVAGTYGGVAMVPVRRDELNKLLDIAELAVEVYLDPDYDPPDDKMEKALAGVFE